jgi:hypothetical protein
LRRGDIRRGCNRLYADIRRGHHWILGDTRVCVPRRIAASRGVRSQLPLGQSDIPLIHMICMPCIVMLRHNKYRTSNASDQPMIA